MTRRIARAHLPSGFPAWFAPRFGESVDAWAGRLAAELQARGETDAELDAAFRALGGVTPAEAWAAADIAARHSDSQAAHAEAAAAGVSRHAMSHAWRRRVGPA